MQTILNKKEIRKRYLKGWFFIDLLSSLPTDYIFVTISKSENRAIARASRGFKFLKLAKMLSLLKLFRLTRLLRYMRKFEDVSIMSNIPYFSIILIRIPNSLLDFLSPKHCGGKFITIFKKLCLSLQATNLTSSHLRMLKLVLLMLLLAHWSGCMQYLVPFLEDFPKDSWVVLDKLVVRALLSRFFYNNPAQKRWDL